MATEVLLLAILSHRVINSSSKVTTSLKYLYCGRIEGVLSEYTAVRAVGWVGV
jgi:hypothetical protein